MILIYFGKCYNRCGQSVRPPYVAYSQKYIILLMECICSGEYMKNDIVFDIYWKWQAIAIF